MKTVNTGEEREDITYSIGEEGMPQVFGIRHLSPAGAYYLRSYLDRAMPKLILIEGPSDFNKFIPELSRKDILPPVALMSYTLEAPIRTILYPFAEYSPEYQAIIWAKENNCKCLFCDLPSDIFLGLAKVNEKTSDEEPSAAKRSEIRRDIYKRLDEVSEDGDHDFFWERTMEQAKDMYGYIRGAAGFGSNLRALTLRGDKDGAENLIREAYMRKVLNTAVKEGIAPADIFMVVGAFHVDGIVEGLRNNSKEIDDIELESLPKEECRSTLMPYSYYRLSQRSGYGAGNKAPAYYELLWKGICRGEGGYAPLRYFSEIAAFQRERGDMVSSAEVIEAIRLATELASLHGSHIPTLGDLRDAALTCLGHGEFAPIAYATAAVEIGTKMGSIPEGLSRTSIQSDFYQKLDELKLEKYRSLIAEEIALDLRENIRLKTEKAAFLDLHRSFFLHKLRIMNIQFAEFSKALQDKATWAERWVLQWTPEAEIQIVEAVLKGDTIEQAAAFVLKERTEEAKCISDIAEVIEDAFYCGMPQSLGSAVESLQKSAVDAVAPAEIASTCESLSDILSFGDIRKLDRTPLKPILEQLFLRFCLILPEEASCDDAGGKVLAEAIITLHKVLVSQDFLDEERWYTLLYKIAGRDDLNTRISGLSAAILLEVGRIDKEELGREVERRLSKGIPADLGAGWFEGVAMKNRYALIARLVLWEKLSNYLDELDDREFKRSLIFLRRAFADFSSEEKYQIAENLGEIWKVDKRGLSESIQKELNRDELEELKSLDEFDFEDI